MSTIDDNKRFVRQFFDAMSQGDVAKLVGAYAEDGSVQTMGNTLISGTFNRDAIAAAADGIFDVFPNGIEFTIKDMVAEGNKVAVEASSSGEHVSGQTYANQYHFLFEIIDGKLKSLKEYLDTEVVTDVLCGGQRPPFGDA